MFAIDRELCSAQKQDMFSREKGKYSRGMGHKIKWSIRACPTKVRNCKLQTTSFCNQISNFLSPVAVTAVDIPAAK